MHESDGKEPSGQPNEALRAVRFDHRLSSHSVIFPDKNQPVTHGPSRVQGTRMADESAVIPITVLYGHRTILVT